jgi:hypothetical protein
MWRFAKSVLAGTIAGAAIPMIVTVPLAVGNLISPLTGHLDIFGSIYFAALPLLISFGLVFLSSILIGLPAAMILRFLCVESTFSYQMIGGAAGFLVTLIGLLVIGATAGFWMCILGVIAGAFTARTWWRSAKASSVR